MPKGLQGFQKGHPRLKLTTKGDFYKGHPNKGRKLSGLSIKEYKKNWDKSNRDRLIGYNKKWKKENPDKVENYRLLTSYGISLEQYNQMFVNQNGLCAICFNREVKSNTIKLSVDHNHQTNKIRGLLCNNCNKGLGDFKDSKDLLFKAIKYLKKYGE